MRRRPASQRATPMDAQPASLTLVAGGTRHARLAPRRPTSQSAHTHIGGAHVPSVSPGADAAASSPGAVGPRHPVPPGPAGVGPILEIGHEGVIADVQLPARLSACSAGSDRDEAGGAAPQARIVSLRFKRRPQRLRAIAAQRGRQIANRHPLGAAQRDGALDQALHSRRCPASRRSASLPPPPRSASPAAASDTSTGSRPTTPGCPVAGPAAAARAARRRTAGRTGPRGTDHRPPVPWQILVRRHDDSGIDPPAGVAAHALDHQFLDGAQQLGLRRRTGPTLHPGTGCRRRRTRTCPRRPGRRSPSGLRCRTAPPRAAISTSAAQLTAMKGPPRRRPSWWSCRATSSLPVPLSP